MAANDSRTAPVSVERSLSANRTPRLVLGVGALLVGAVLVMLVGERLPASFVMGALALLATVGVAASLGALFGLVRVGGRSTRSAVAHWALRSEADGLAIATRDGEIVFANRAYGDASRRPDGTPLTPDLALSVDESSIGAMARLADAAARGEADGDVLRSTDGRWLQLTVMPADVTPTHRDLVAWRVRDVTADRDRRDASFVAAQDAIAHLDSAPVGFLTVRADGIVTHLNATAARWLGMDLTAFQRRELPLDDLFAEGARIVADGADRFDAELLVPEGGRLPVRTLVGSPLAHGERSVVVIPREGSGAADDATLSALAPAQFFEASPVAMASLDAEGRVVRTNRAFDRVLGIAPGRALIDALGEADVTGLRRALEATPDGRSTIEPVDCIVPGERTGSVRHLRFAVSAVRAEEETAIVAVLDNTERMEIEQAYVQAQKMEAVGQLAGGMAHDFNNVLTGISVSTDLLLDSHPETDPSNAELRTIRTNVTRAAALVRHLLAFSKKQTMQPKVLPLADVLADADLLLRNMAKHVKLLVEPQGDLWHVRADRNQLDQVLTNLVKNAGDATPSGGTVTIGARNVPAAEASEMPYRGLPHEDFAMIEVTDTGHGMDRATLERVFEPFFTTKEVGKGTGLGLAMVYGTIKQSGGFVYVDSEVGRGTRFRILLPRHLPNEDDLAAIERRSRASRNKRDITGTGTILLVEDEHVVRAASLKALRRQGYTVHDAADGEEALEVLEDLGGEVDLIVSDVVMPEMNGPSMFRAVREIYGDRHRVVFVSGHAEDAFASDLPDDAEFLFLAKPYNLSQLAATVKDALANG